MLTDESGQPVSGSAVWYFPYGEARPGSGNPLTDYRFTGQRLEGTIALYDYGARFYDPALGRFVSADTVVPRAGNPQALNRYAYVLNSPLRYVDPTGHRYDPHGDDFGPQDPPPPPPPYLPLANKGMPSEQEVDWTYYVIPSTVGLRAQVNAGYCWPVLGPEKFVGVGPGVSGGVSLLWNWRSGELGAVYDINPSIQVGLEGPNASLTWGPVLSWGASSLDPLLDGVSLNAEYSQAVLYAMTVSTSVETNVDVPRGVNGLTTGNAQEAAAGFAPHPFFTSDPGSGSPIIITDYYGVIGLGWGIDLGIGAGPSFQLGSKVKL